MYTYFRCLTQRYGFKKQIFALFTFGLLLAQASFALESVSPTIKTDAKVASPGCQYKDFNSFLSAFTESKEIQRAFTHYPLKHVQVVDPTAAPLPKVSIRFLEKGAVKFPLHFDKKSLTQYGLEIKSEDRGSGVHVVIETSAGEKSLGQYVEYKFVPTSKCWKLAEISNQST